jgi:hypothetical protein
MDSSSLGKKLLYVPEEGEANQKLVKKSIQRKSFANTKDNKNCAFEQSDFLKAR